MLPAITRLSEILDEFDVNNIDIKEATTKRKFGAETFESLKSTTINMWFFSGEDLIFLLAHMFEELGLVKEFSLEREKLLRFLILVRICYNQNPFHNFQHCFCVTQMVC